MCRHQSLSTTISSKEQKWLTRLFSYDVCYVLVKLVVVTLVIVVERWRVLFVALVGYVICGVLLLVDVYWQNCVSVVGVMCPWHWCLTFDYGQTRSSCWWPSIQYIRKFKEFSWDNSTQLRKGKKRDRWHASVHNNHKTIEHVISFTHILFYRLMKLFIFPYVTRHPLSWTTFVTTQKFPWIFYRWLMTSLRTIENCRHVWKTSISFWYTYN